MENEPDLKKARRRKALTDAATVLVPNQLPPHSKEAEQGVLGCIFLDPNLVLPECVEKLKAGSEVFYDLKHQIIYDAMIALSTRGDVVDLITVQQYLKDNKQLEAVGGIAYLMALGDAVPSAANAGYYIKILFDKFILRRIIRVSSDFVASAYEHEGETSLLVDRFEADAMSVGQERVTETSKMALDLVNKALHTIEDFHKLKDGVVGLRTGFPDLDKLTSGLLDGTMIIIAARPSIGKTSLSMNIAENVVLDSQLPVGVFSLEMSAESLMLRMLCCRARVNLRNVKEGFLAERDFPKITHVAGKLGKAPIHIDDSAGLSIIQLRAKARRMYAQHGIRLFIIDYLQLLHSTSKKARDNRQQEIADISAGIKALAKELKVPIIVLCQLNRDVDREKSGVPKLSHLRESGSIEQDADVVGLLYKVKREDDAEEVDTEESDGVRVNLNIAKQREGPTGEVELVFLKSLTRFESVSKVAAADIPNDEPGLF